MEELIQKLLDEKRAEWEDMNPSDIIMEIESDGEFYIESGEYLTKSVFMGKESEIYGITKAMSDWAMDNGRNIDEDFFYTLSDILNDSGIDLDLDMGDLYLTLRRTGNDLIGYLYNDEPTGRTIQDLDDMVTEWYPASEFEDSWPGISLLFGMCSRPIIDDEVDASDFSIYGIDEYVPYLTCKVSEITRL